MSEDVQHQNRNAISSASAHGHEIVLSRETILKLRSLEKRLLDVTNRNGERPTEPIVEEATHDDCFRIAIAGGPKSGKTCLLNSLIGAPVLPMPVVPVSGGPIWLKWGEERGVRVHNRDGSVRDVPISELDLAVGETRVEVSWPLDLCERGVQFVEVPAYGPGAAEELEGADLLIFVLSCRALGSKTDLELIETAAEVGVTEVLFICNQVDAIGPDDLPVLQRRSSALLAPLTTAPGNPVFFLSGKWAVEGYENQEEYLRRAFGRIGNESVRVQPGRASDGGGTRQGRNGIRPHPTAGRRAQTDERFRCHISRNVFAS